MTPEELDAILRGELDAARAHVADELNPEPPPPTWKSLPDREGWWMRRRGREEQWFLAELVDRAEGDPEGGIYVEMFEDLVRVEQFSSPLTRWWGPVAPPEPEKPEVFV